MERVKDIFEIRRSWEYKSLELQAFVGLVLFLGALICFS